MKSVSCLSTKRSINRPIDVNGKRENRVDNTDVLLPDTRRNSHDERLAPRGPLHSRRVSSEIPGKIKTCGFGGRASGKTEGKERKLGSRLQGNRSQLVRRHEHETIFPSLCLYFSLSLSLLHTIHAHVSPVSERCVLFVFVLSCQRSQESSISISCPEGIVPKRI